MPAGMSSPLKVGPLSTAEWLVVFWYRVVSWLIVMVVVFLVSSHRQDRQRAAAKFCSCPRDHTGSASARLVGGAMKKAAEAAFAVVVGDRPPDAG
jgi:hypothetical protein